MTERAHPQSASQDARNGAYRRGPVTLRGHEVPDETTDQHLLDSHGPADWVHTDPCRSVTALP